MKRLTLFIPLVVFLVICLAAAIFFWRGLDSTNMPSALIGKPFPEFSLPRLDNQSQRINRQAMLGQVALVNVWASWCVACKYEHPVLNRLAQQGITVIGINYKDDTAEAIKWLDDLGDPYRFVIVDQQGSLAIDLGVFGAPETYLIDRQGIIRYKHVGIVDLALWNETLKPLVERYSQ